MSIPTAEEFLKRDESGVYTEVDITKAMIDFAKLHVEAFKTALELEKQQQLDLTNITRLEVINHASNRGIFSIIVKT